MAMLKHTLKLFTILLIPMMLFSGETGKIAGSVTDKSNGNILPGVNVLLDGTTMGAATAPSGDFYILNIPPGIYSVKFSFIGYAEVTIENVRVTKDLTTNLYNIELSSEAIAGKEIIVVAEKPLIEINATNEVRVIRGEDIRNMPIRGYASVAALQTGAVVDASGNIHIRGGRTEEVGYYVDGVLVNNSFTLGRAGDIPNLSLEEVSYQAGGFGAEYGSANAGIVSTTTKTGGNRLEATFEAITDGFLPSDLTDDKEYSYSYGYNLGSFAVGGPMPGFGALKLFAAFEMNQRADASPTNSTVPYYDPDLLNPITGLPNTAEAFVDVNNNNVYDYDLETFTDANNNGRYDKGYLEIDPDDIQYKWGPKPDNGTNTNSLVANALLDLKDLTGLAWKLRVGINTAATDRSHYSHGRTLFDYYNDASTKDAWGTSGNLTHRFNTSNTTFNSNHIRLSGAVPGVDNMFFSTQFSMSDETYKLQDPVFGKGEGHWVYDDGTISSETLPYLQNGKREDFANPMWVYEDADGNQVERSYWDYSDDLSFVQINYDTSWINPLYRMTGSGPATLVQLANYSLAGSASTSFQKRNTSRTTVKGSLTWQYNKHELKFGGEFKESTVRYYRLGSGGSLSRYFANNPMFKEDQDRYLWDPEYNNGMGALLVGQTDNIADYLQDPSDTWHNSDMDGNGTVDGIEEGDLDGDGDADYDDYYQDYLSQAYIGSYAENIGYDVTGEKKVNSGQDAARKPQEMAFFIQDKFELKDLILNVGFRYDMIDGKNQVFNPETGGNTNIVITNANTIAEQVYATDKNDNGVLDPKEYTSDAPTDDDATGKPHQINATSTTQISPRIGIAFPVTDKTVFHAQYGRYLQNPELSRQYISYSRFSANLQQGNFTISANPNLKPVRTTEYEIGMKQMLSQDVSLDITLFYKQMADYVQIRNVAAIPTGYALYVNGDYGTVKGLSLSVNTRRINNAQINANYTLSWAGGTGSNASGLYRIAWQGGNDPTFISPLDFDQRHTGNITLDYRTGARSSIPFLNNFGANMLFRFGSGMPYTATKPYTAVFGAIASQPIGSLNSANMPWTYNLDMKIDKSFSIAGVRMNAFLWVINALDNINVDDVYSPTGMANNDGYLTTPSGESWLNNVAFDEECECPEAGAALYESKINNPYNYGSPRIIRFGIRVDL
jgi:outer membrane receptor protein involved in Fe transport